MWNNGQQQTAWWPTYTYSQFPAVSTQDATVDESQQWAIRAAMWAQQKKIQEHFEQQMHLYQEQAKKEAPREDLPPLPPDMDSPKPPPPPDSESSRPPLPPSNIEPHRYEENEFGRHINEVEEGHPTAQQFDNHPEDRQHENRLGGEVSNFGHTEDGHRRYGNENKQDSEFKKGRWKPFGMTDDTHPNQFEEVDQYHHGHYDEEGRDRHHNSNHHHPDHYSHHSHHGPEFFDDRYHSGDFHHSGHYPGGNHMHEHQFHHRGPPPPEMVRHPVPDFEVTPALPPPMFDQGQNMEFFGSLPRLPAFPMPPPGELPMPEPFPAEDVGLPGIEVAKKKGLPMWLREGLEKLEKEKQKKLAKDKGQGEKGKSKMPTISGYQHEASSEESQEEEDDDDEKEPIESQDNTNTEAENKDVDEEKIVDGTDSSDEEKEESDKEEGVDLMLRIKKMVTEVLLNVTNEEIKSIAYEVYNEAKRKALNSANQLRSSGGLDALRSAMGSYASSSDESTDNEKEDSVSTERSNFQAKAEDEPVTLKPASTKLNPPTQVTKTEHSKPVKSSSSNSGESSDSSESGSSSSSGSSDSSSSDSGEENTAKSKAVDTHNPKRKPKAFKTPPERKERSRVSESDSDSSYRKKKKVKKRERSPSPRHKSRKRSRSSSPNTSRKGREDSASGSRKSSKSRRRRRSSSDDRSDRKRGKQSSSKHREKSPRKKSKQKSESSKSKSVSKKKRKQKEEFSDDSSDSREKRSPRSKKSSKRKHKSRSKSRSRSASPRRKKSGRDR